MGRPKKSDGELIDWDIRITPDGGRPVQFAPTDEDFTKFLACLEGGFDTGKQLHYHIYCQTRRSDTYIRKYFTTLAGGTGNKHWSKRLAHEGTIGYVIKGGQVVCRHGFDTKLIDEYYEKSKQYRKDLEAARKRKQRDLHKSLTDIVAEVAPPFPRKEDVTYQGPRDYGRELVTLLLNKYHELDLKFPPRSTLDSVVCKHLYKNPDYQWFVRDRYAFIFAEH